MAQFSDFNVDTIQSGSQWKLDNFLTWQGNILDSVAIDTSNQ